MLLCFIFCTVFILVNIFLFASVQVELSSIFDSLPTIIYMQCDRKTIEKNPYPSDVRLSHVTCIG